MNTVTVKSTNQSIEETIKIAEKLRKEFIDEANLFICDWYKNIVNHFINSYPPAAKKLTEEHKIHINKEVKQLQDSVHIELTKKLNSEDYWWHLGEIKELHRDFYKTINNLLDYELRVILGKVGNILEEYGFIKKNHFDGDKGFVSHKDKNNNYYFEYVYPVYWSDMMKRKMDNYWENYKFYLKIK